MTLSDRKKTQVDAIRSALPMIELSLRDYAKIHGGRFLLYGSAVSGRLHYESDIDVLADFPRDQMGAALDFANELGARYDVAIDAIAYSHCKPDFLNRILRDAKVLA